MATKTRTRKTSKKKAQTPVLHVAFVLDMSGSMMPIRSAAIEGVNEYLRQLKEDENAKEARWTLIAFDTIFERWAEGVPIAQAAFVGEEYLPRAGTALHDAIATAVTTIQPTMKKGEKALVVVLTDGYENSSQEYPGEHGRQRLATLVESLEETGDWTFIYLGANDYDVKTTAASLGMNAGSSIAYTATGSGTQTAMREASSNTAFYAANANDPIVMAKVKAAGLVTTSGGSDDVREDTP